MSFEKWVRKKRKEMILFRGIVIKEYDIRVRLVSRLVRFDIRCMWEIRKYVYEELVRSNSVMVFVY